VLAHTSSGDVALSVGDSHIVLRVGGGACGICYEFFTNLTSTTLAAKTDA
jgi:hypothetical protein